MDWYKDEKIKNEIENLSGTKIHKDDWLPEDLELKKNFDVAIRIMRERSTDPDEIEWLEDFIKTKIGFPHLKFSAHWAKESSINNLENTQQWKDRMKYLQTIEDQTIEEFKKYEDFLKEKGIIEE